MKKVDLYTIYKMLNDGVHFHRYYDHSGNISYMCSLYSDNKYIHWCSYGSSANPNNLEALAWIILTIFDCNLYEFTKQYKPYKYDDLGFKYPVSYDEYL